MINSLIIYTQIFSRIRINKAVDPSYLYKGIAFMSLFGFLIGLLEASLYYLFTLIFPIQISFILTLFFDILITGGYHLDALSDTADGLFSSRKKERMLEIMKDSRVGSNGVLALIFYYAIMFFGYHHLSLSLWEQVCFIVSLHLIGKAGLSLQTYKIIYARKDAPFSHFFKGAKTEDIMIGQLVPIIWLVLSFQLKGIIIYSLLLLSAFIYRHFVYQKIDGHTGDTIGAFVQLSHLVLVIGLLVKW